MEDNKSTTVKKMVKSGITFGSALAMVISYKKFNGVRDQCLLDHVKRQMNGEVC